MNKMLVAVFENETTAYEGLSALKDLHQDGDITLYATAVISKNDKGELQLKSAADLSPIGAATGLLAGSMIGLLGGPVGLAIGAASGFFGGLLFDISADDINIKFVDEVSTALTKGKTAVVAEIDESWTIPVDTMLANALVFRRMRNEVLEDQLERESKAIAAEYQKLKEELNEAGEKTRAEIKSAIGKLEAKARIVGDQLERKLIEAKNEADAKTDAIHEQMKDVKDKRKAKMNRRMEELEAEYAFRSEKLKHAAKLISQAFGPKETLQKSEKDYHLTA